MDPVERIEQIVVNGSDGFFDDPLLREDLHITIRIAGDFYRFLAKFGDNPPPKEIAYVTDTIRSGTDWFFGLAHLCTMIHADAVDSDAPKEFPLLRAKFMRDFENLAASTNSGAEAALASLLALTHCELVFLAHNFPSAILKAAEG
jgi:hypothetical protein